MSALTPFKFLALAGAVAMAGAQDPPRQPGPQGYDDTPLLPNQKWRVHDLRRPRPRVVTPPPESAEERNRRAPSDAVVLFDGRDLSQWNTRARGPEQGKLVPPRWKIQQGYIEIVPGTGDLISRERFGDAQFHIEWSVPERAPGSGQGRGNSGVIIMGRYEIQVLESYENVTYADGQAAAIYGQYPPLVNASRKPGEWQSYDIIFEAPRFEGSRLVKPAYVTVFHNGVLVHYRRGIMGAAAHRTLPAYSPHAPEEPLVLQDHDCVVRFRNIWVRRLAGYDQP